MTAPYRIAALCLSLILLGLPAAALVVARGGNVAMFLAVAVSLFLLLFNEKTLPSAWAPSEGGRVWLPLVIALALPLTAVLIVNVAHGRIVANTLDSPTRFLIAIVLFLGLRRVIPAMRSWMDLAFPIGAIAAGLFGNMNGGDGRAASVFLNPIHFGDIALILAVLSLLAIDWLRKDPLWVQAVKILGCAAGCYVSWASQSRGGWVAVPVIAVICIAVGMRGQSVRAKVSAGALVLAGILALLLFSSLVQERFASIGSDLQAFSAGQTDTSIGIRLELWVAAIKLFLANPVWGLGPHGFHNMMDTIAATGQLTPMAADLGRGEVHNQVLAYATDYGIFGLMAILSIYVVPAYLFCRGLRQPGRGERRAALMGLTLTIGFFIFGLTVETFNLKVTTAFYATMLAVFAAFTYPVEPSRDPVI